MLNTTYVGRVIRDARGKKPQRAVANAATISESTWRNIETGVTKNPGLRTVEKMGEVLGLSLMEILRKALEMQHREEARAADETLYGKGPPHYSMIGEPSRSLVSPLDTGELDLRKYWTGPPDLGALINDLINTQLRFSKLWEHVRERIYEFER